MSLLYAHHCTPLEICQMRSDVYTVDVGHLPCVSVDSTCAVWLIWILMLAYGKIWTVRCKNHWSPLARQPNLGMKQLSNWLYPLLIEPQPSRIWLIQIRNTIVQFWFYRLVWICGKCWVLWKMECWNLHNKQLYSGVVTKFNPFNYIRVTRFSQNSLNTEKLHLKYFR